MSSMYCTMPAHERHAKRTRLQYPESYLSTCNEIGGNAARPARSGASKESVHCEQNKWMNAAGRKHENTELTCSAPFPCTFVDVSNVETSSALRAATSG